MHRRPLGVLDIDPLPELFGVVYAPILCGLYAVRVMEYDPTCLLPTTISIVL